MAPIYSGICIMEYDCHTSHWNKVAGMTLSGLLPEVFSTWYDGKCRRTGNGSVCREGTISRNCPEDLMHWFKEGSVYYFCCKSRLGLTDQHWQPDGAFLGKGHFFWYCNVTSNFTIKFHLNPRALPPNAMMSLLGLHCKWHGSIETCWLPISPSPIPILSSAVMEDGGRKVWNSGISMSSPYIYL